MDNTYYTKSADGSFRLVTMNNETLTSVLSAIVQDRILSAINAAIENHVDAALVASGTAGKVQDIIDGIDLGEKVDEGIEAIDIEDMVRTEVQDKIENLDISVDVSI